MSFNISKINNTRISKSLIDDIMSRVMLSEIIRQDTRLTKKGNEFIGICPMHHEKTPSFSVNDEKGVFYCFGCGENGNVFSYLQKKRGFSFVESVNFMADYLGISIETFTSNLSACDQRYYNLLQYISDYASKNLKNSPNIIKYLEQRSIDSESIDDFHIGFINKISHLASLLIKSGYKNDEIKKSGLSLFQERIIFPIFDQHGCIVGFGGRSIDENVKPKYINSPQSEVFQKKNLLYGYNIARKNINKDNEFVVVEGYTDVIALNRIGIKTAVAPLGTSFSKNHIEILWKHGRSNQTAPTICFDGDVAGINAAFRVIEFSISEISFDKTINFVFLPEGEDPDSMSRKVPKQKFYEFLSKKEVFSEVLWRYCIKKYGANDFKTPEDRAFFTKNACNFLNTISDSTVKKFYILDFRKRLANFCKAIDYKAIDITEDYVGNSVSKNATNSPTKNSSSDLAKSLSKKFTKEIVINRNKIGSKQFQSNQFCVDLNEVKDTEIVKKLLLSIIIFHRDILEHVQEKISSIIFENCVWEKTKNSLLCTLSFSCKNDELKLKEYLSQITEEADFLMKKYFSFINKSGDKLISISKNPLDFLELWEEVYVLFQKKFCLLSDLKKMLEQVRQSGNEDAWQRLRKARNCLLR